MMTNKLLAGIVFSLLLASCASKPSMHTPTDEEIRKAAMDQYDHLMEADGGGGYHAEDIQVLRTRPGSSETEYFAEVRAKGTHKLPPLANPRPDEPFDETREVPMVWEKDKWVYFRGD